VNARMPEYAYAQHVRTKSPFPQKRWLRAFNTLHEETLLVACISSRERGTKVLRKCRFLN